MAMISVSHLTFGYDGSFDTVFEDVSFQFDTNWKLGLIGRNGRGKTTFLQLLMGRLEYRGTISSSVPFDYFPFPVSDESEMTLSMAEGLLPNLELWRLQRELSLLEVDEEVLYRPFATLSQGERTKVLLAVLFLRDNHFLLIDEPTNHLDEEARRVLGGYLALKKGFLLVSHDRELLDGCVNHVLSINRADIVLQKGNYTSWQQNRQKQDQFEEAEQEKLKKEVSRLSMAARAAAGWSHQVEASKYGNGPVDRGYLGHQSAKMMKRAKSLENRRQNAVKEKAKLLKNLETAEDLSIHPLTYPKRNLAEARELSLFYDEKIVASGISFLLEEGDRIALTGKNGSGKSTLLKLFLGQKIKHTGSFTVGNGLKISYIPQDTSSLCGSLNAWIQEQKLEESLFKSILRKLDFSRVQFEKQLEEFSEGQKKKVLLAASLCTRANVYIWDEPLNFIDVISRTQLEKAILRGRPTIVFVEHDRVFRDKIATKTIEFK